MSTKEPSVYLRLLTNNNYKVMKKAILFILFMTLQTVIYAQERQYLPFLEEGKAWYYYYYGSDDESHKWLVVGDEVEVDGKSYKKIVDWDTRRCVCLMREEGSKVYCMQDGNEYLLYDFGLNVGDTFETPNGNATVVAVKEIMVGSRSHRVLDVRDNENNSYSNWWIEGVGGWNYLTKSILGADDNYELVQCLLDGVPLFTCYNFWALPVFFAQERQYVPFVEEGKSWYCGYYHPYDIFPPSAADPAGEGIDHIFTIQGDTQINDKAYKKVYCQCKEYYGDDEFHYYCAVREEDYRVYIVKNGATEEKLIYDFSNPGELATYPFDSREYVRNGGIRFERFLPGQLEYSITINNDGIVDFRDYYGKWIEGVGAVSNCPFDIKYDNDVIFDKDVWVRTVMKDGEYVYNDEWSAKPSFPPGPTLIDNRRRIDTPYKNSPLYDLQGRQLKSLPNKGVYIQNGKKVVVK